MIIALGIALLGSFVSAESAVGLLGTHHPFAVQRFETDGRKIFAMLDHKDKAATTMLNVVDGQASFASIIARYMREIDYDKLGDAFRWWPLGKNEPVFADPKFSFGVPLTKSGHVPTRAIHCAIKAGDSPEDVARWFDIPLEEVCAAEKFQRRLAA